MASKPNLYVQVLVELTRAALLRTGDSEFLASMDGATYRVAIEPTAEGELHYLVVNGADSPVRFADAVVKAALEAEQGRPTH